MATKAHLLAQIQLIMATSTAQISADASGFPQVTGQVTSPHDRLAALLALTLGLSKAPVPFANFEHSYGSGTVSTAAWTQVVASVAADVNKMEIFDSSTQIMILGIGAAGFEVPYIYIPVNGNGKVDVSIPVGTRISIKALTADATTGYSVMNFYS